MTIVWLPWAAIAIGVASLFVRRRSDEDSGAGANPASLAIVTVALLAALFALSKLSKEGESVMLTLYGVAAGSVAGMALALGLGSFIKKAVSSAGFAFGALAVAGASLAIAHSVKPTEWPLVLFGLVLGLGGCAWASAGSSAGSVTASAALGAAVVAAADQLGRLGPGNHAAQAGTAFALVAGIASALALGVLEGDSKKQKLAPIVITLLLAGGGWLVTQRVLELKTIWQALTAGAAAATIVNWLLPDDDNGSFGFVLSTLIWLGIATLGFGMAKGFGMAVACLGAVCVLTSVRNGRALLSMGPLLGLVLYRIFRELFADTGRALDIGQHYGLIGLLVGAAMPILAWEWWQASKDQENAKRSICYGLWAVLLVGFPVLITMMLSSKGYVGWIAGLGLSGVILGLKGERSSTPLAFSLGVASLSAVCYKPLQDYINLTREQKVVTLGWSFGIFIVLAALIWFLSMRNSESAKEGETS